MPIPFDFDFKNPDYVKVWQWRVKLLEKIRANPGSVEVFKAYYAANPWDFINHWGSTYDPRNIEIGLPPTIPFLLFDKQEEWIRWIMDRWHNRENGISEKSRDVGMSWVALALSCTLCLFNREMSIGFGSRKEEYVDKLSDPKSLFWKARMFMAKLPREFRGGWNLKTHAPHMRIIFPESGSIIAGESGDGIGRGDRKAIYFVDEAAHIERPELVEMSLSNTTNCRIDISSAKGMANPFAIKRHGGKIPVFTIHWRDDPRKDDAWYAAMELKVDNPVVMAQEVDINYSASVEGVVIPSAWVQAAIDAATKLGIEVTGNLVAALDLADEGVDLNALCMRKGIEVRLAEAWSGKDSDSLYTAQRAVTLCDEAGCDTLQYDADGLGAFIRSDFRTINERRKSQLQRQLAISTFRGSGAVTDPEKEMVKGRKNKDYFMNRKAQAWWALRFRFQNTWRAIRGEPYDAAELISLSSTLPNLTKIIVELSQPTYVENSIGKIVINKTPNGLRSPNYADSVMMVFSPVKRANGLFSS